ncbi:PREDICTED: serine/threonine-protein kinase PLK4-like isoform X2 [Amphimedon queenslandica]|uniref:Serine/threonine-protein kinase PLK4 n=1 Tax=Amphimedon queenslandica TaxID=400682 RepID=A0AAN0JSB2_AMPQE|nr:PREDICTED: serine/threonine-protein kinase PLK4-like isoform X2 [Amphimedon queenslandica]|eukprot:XP_019859902.1 PREDICTED: serine/threonine-protein kinase PLK4-like isoform X2 [Amphimedon queenslandica]
MIDKKLMVKKGMTERVKNEVKIHSHLKHPSILELYDFFEDSNYVYLILEFCQNGELNRYLKHRQKSLSEDEVRIILNQVVKGLIYLHSFNIVHRDLSLSNILLTSSMDAKIADFGLSVTLDLPGDKHHTLCGTPNYIAPEVAKREAHGLESDIWSLGCMVYTMLVGTPPFDTDDVQSTLDNVVNGDFDIPQYLSAEAQDLIISLLKKHPSKRLTLQQVLYHSFTKGVQQENVLQKRTLSLTTPVIATYRGDCQFHGSRVLKNIQLEAPASVDSGNVTLATNYSGPTSRYSTRRGPVKATFFPSSGSHLQEDQSRKATSGLHHRRAHSLEDVCRGNDEIMKLSNCFSGEQSVSFSLKDNDVPSSSVYSQRDPVTCISRNSSLDSSVSERRTTANSTMTCTRVPAFTTSRLHPISQQTRSASVNITDDGAVTIQQIKSKEIFKVSSDGQTIDISTVDESSNSVSYCYEELPKKYWKKYKFAAQFVNLVKSKTPKVTMYTEFAKCLLMENEEFEMVMYNGNKYHLGGKATLRCTILQDDKLTSSLSFETVQNIPDEYQDIYASGMKCMNRCKDVETAIRSIEESDETLLPIIIKKVFRQNS